MKKLGITLVAAALSLPLFAQTTPKSATETKAPTAQTTKKHKKHHKKTAKTSTTAATKTSK